MTRVQKAGVNDPLFFPAPGPVGQGTDDTLKAGAAFHAPDPHTLVATIRCAGALAVTLRGLFTGGGTLSFKYLRPVPPYTGQYGVGNPADKPVLANAEFLYTFEPNGESAVLVTFTEAAAGSVTFLDVMQQ